MEAPGSFTFMSFGVGVKVESNRASQLDWIRSRIESIMAGHVEPIADRPVQRVISIVTADDGLLSLFLDGEDLGRTSSEPIALQYFCAQLKLAISASARLHIIVHAGVVGVGNKAVVLPAHSFQGKTTLVRELVSRGATYYSDDLAVFDLEGLVHPFAKTLSLRGISNAYEQVEQSVESLGGVTGAGPLPVGILLLTHFDPAAQWRPQEISAGHALLKLTEHTQNLRANPRVALDVLGKVVNGGAILLESPRRDASEVADHILERLSRVAFGSAHC